MVFKGSMGVPGKIIIEKIFKCRIVEKKTISIIGI